MLLKFKKQLSESGEVYFLVKVRPNASRNKIKEILQSDYSKIIKIDIESPPISGRANKELVYFLAEEFSVLSVNVKILSGANEKIKLIKIIAK